MLIHCAYHFDRAGDHEVERRVNVDGTDALLRAAGARGIPMVVTSSMSARPPVTSTYGSTKRAIEEVARDAGAVVVRPGLVWHELAKSGLVASLMRIVQALPLVPVPRMREPNQCTVHADDLATVLINCAANSDVGRPSEPITVGHPHLFTLRDICTALAAARNTRTRIVEIAPAIPQLALAVTDLLRAPVGFRKDNLAGLLEASPPRGLTTHVGGTELRHFCEFRAGAGPPAASARHRA